MMSEKLNVTTAESKANSRPALHQPGLAYLWVLNDACEHERIDKMIEAFAKAKVGAVCLHPRAGLLLPYGGDDWFAFIQRTAQRCIDAGLTVWLYDEDPYPSGACGGWITATHPEWRAHRIERIVADGVDADGLFAFPAGKLLWCGIVRESDGATVDLTARVGVVRRQWNLRDPCDSRGYYPNTPLYECPRSETYSPEMAVRLSAEDCLENGRLMAFVARPVVDEDKPWGTLPDTLNPAVTDLFLKRTHERYRRSLGEHFGAGIPAMFTDEPKPHALFPWTPGMLEDYEARFGEALGPRLWCLFSESNDPGVMLTRLRFREWVTQRFESAWVKPVASWCRRHRLQLIGHISPEDDPVQQTATVGNLMTLFRYFDLPGIDLIIPAVGDHRHPLINVGVIAASSAAQQQGRPGVLSESLGASGHGMTVAQAGNVLRWQAVMGVSTTVVHGAFTSMEGLRQYDAPPDFGPFSERWPGMQDIASELAAIQSIVTDARQLAPVAVLWPIRSFHADPAVGYTHDSPRRDALVDVLRRCLDRQVGVHLLDEAALLDAHAEQGELILGKARYRHVLIAACSVLSEKTVLALRTAAQQGVAVTVVDQMPQWQQGDAGLTPFENPGWPIADRAAVIATLPRLIEVEPEAMDIRCTAWEKHGKLMYLLLNLHNQTQSLTVNDKPLEPQPNTVYVSTTSGRSWSILDPRNAAVQA